MDDLYDVLAQLNTAIAACSQAVMQANAKSAQMVDKGDAWVRDLKAESGKMHDDVTRIMNQLKPNAGR